MNGKGYKDNDKIKNTPPVGLEPTTARLRAARSTDWARKACYVMQMREVWETREKRTKTMREGGEMIACQTILD